MIYLTLILESNDDILHDDSILEFISPGFKYYRILYRRLPQYLLDNYSVKGSTNLIILTPRRKYLLHFDGHDIYLENQITYQIPQKHFQRIIHQMQFNIGTTKQNISQKEIEEIKIQLSHYDDLEEKFNENLAFFLKRLPYNTVQKIKTYLHIQENLAIIEDNKEIILFLQQQLKNKNDDPVLKLLVNTYLYRYTKEITSDEILQNLFSPLLSRADLEILNIFALVDTENGIWQNRIFYPFELIIEKIAFGLLLNGYSTSFVENLYRTNIGLISQSIISNKRKSNIYNTLFGLTRTSFSFRQSKNFLLKAIRLLLEDIEYTNKSNISQLLLLASNYVEIPEFNTHGFKELKEKLSQIIDATSKNIINSYEDIFRTVRIIDTLQKSKFSFSLDPIILQYCRQINHSIKILDWVNPEDFERIPYLFDSISLKLKKLSTDVEQFDSLQKNDLFSTHQRIENIIHRFATIYTNNFANPEELIAELLDYYWKNNHGQKKSVNLLKRSIENHLIIICVMTLSELNRSTVLNVLEIFDSEVNNKIHPKSLIVNLIKTHFQLHKLNEIEMNYINKIGLILDQNNLFSTQIPKLLEEVVQFSAIQKTLLLPVMTNNNQKTATLLETPGSSTSMSKRLQPIDRTHFRNFQETIKKNLSSSTHILINLHPEYQLLDPIDLAEQRYDDPEIYDHISYHLLLGQAYANNNQYTLALNSVNDGIDLAKSLPLIRSEDWISLFKDRLSYKSKLGNAIEYDAFLVDLATVDIATPISESYTLVDTVARYLEPQFISDHPSILDYLGYMIGFSRDSAANSKGLYHLWKLYNSDPLDIELILMAFANLKTTDMIVLDQIDQLYLDLPSILPLGTNSLKLHLADKLQILSSRVELLASICSTNNPIYRFWALTKLTIALISTPYSTRLTALLDSIIYQTEVLDKVCTIPQILTDLESLTRSLTDTNKEKVQKVFDFITIDDRQMVKRSDRKLPEKVLRRVDSVIETHGVKASDEDLFDVFLD